MGRLTCMLKNGSRRCSIAAAVCVVALVSACSIESPVTVTDRPLAQRLDDRDHRDVVVDEAGQPINSVAPETLAFSEAMASGDFIRLRVAEGANSAGLRSGPGPSYDLIAEVPSGAEVYGTGNQTGEWVHVLYADFDGWLNAQRIALASTTPQDQLIEAAEVEQTPVTYVVVGEAIGVNMRSEPNAAADLVSGAPVGTHVVGTGNTEGSWIEVTFDGVTGWASGNYLDPVGLEAPSPQPAIVKPAAAPAE